MQPVVVVEWARRGGGTIAVPYRVTGLEPGPGWTDTRYVIATDTREGE